ncbi:NADH-quinone oxidoreductase subunit M [Agriterribacter sp.]|uniref:complex I subunit 4 family protein n=1 Tax=Agriterribacter sp. TaxID=2821509 RepID=UPI002CD26F6C|nr:NADH-quinone oxidoreductase subunit M [Agriterribacter sp.]HRO47851.1 NADH-quinone oxidoreductase subunit M [Agriterribacter sp.]HRQ16626.1 NADH-quinone oxidoreductase subunit M [Agriterribacter sp.]
MNPNDVLITFPELLIWFPLLSGLVAFFLTKGGKAKRWALISSFITVAIVAVSFFFTDKNYFHFNNVSYVWMPSIGSSFALMYDGMGRMLCLLTALAFPLAFLTTYNTSYSKPNNFYGLMLLSQAGLMGVFCAMDALVFYFFWELAIIPVYFLASQWGGEKRIQATFKFFVYTFAASLLLMIGIIYVYLHTPDGSFSIHSFLKAKLPPGKEELVFWLFFAAFAVKMPLFPFHTWQPDTYEQSASPVTMILSGVMVKMGVFALIRWLIPVFPYATVQFTHIIIGLSVAGMVYASCIAWVQDDLKRLVAYSSIVHVGLMCAAIFARNQSGTEGVMLQMFNHGINIIGLWIVVELIEKHFGTRKISELGGLASSAPALTVFLVIIALANIALPLTNAFAGEFLMFNGLFQYGKWTTAIALTTIILSAVYTLNMVQKVFYGNTNNLTVSGTGIIKRSTAAALTVVLIIILLLGVYPKLLSELTKDTVNVFMNRLMGL